MGNDQNSVRCQNCGESVSYDSAYCVCGVLASFPNYRQAENEKETLQKRYDSAVTNLKSKNLSQLQEIIEKMAEGSLPTINMPLDVVDNILRSGKYYNYHQLVKLENREVAKKSNAKDRKMVGSAIFTGYEENIVYAALSPSGDGLQSYGEVSVTWDVKKYFLMTRITVHEENSFDFYENHKLGNLESEAPKGHMAIWSDREKIAVTKLEKRINASTSKEQIAKLFLLGSENRKKNVYMEIAIYAEKGLATKHIRSIKMDGVTKDANHNQIQLIKEKAESCNIDISI